MRLLMFITLTVTVLSALAFNFSAIKATPGAKSAERDVASAQLVEYKETSAIHHVVVKDETAWFLSSVFYGHGNQYNKILEANSLATPEQIKVGMKLKIPNPLFQKTQANFEKRYTELWEKRAAALEKKVADGGEVRDRIPASTEISSNSVIPVGKIRSKDSVQGLPFTHLMDTHSSPAGAARDELVLRKQRKANPEAGH